MRNNLILVLNINLKHNLEYIKMKMENREHNIREMRVKRF